MHRQTLWEELQEAQLLARPWLAVIYLAKTCLLLATLSLILSLAMTILALL